jgi:hypothetical protein
MSSAPLDNAWREQRQLAARETQPESSPVPIALPKATAIEAGSAAYPAEAKAVPPRHAHGYIGMAKYFAGRSEETEAHNPRSLSHQSAGLERTSLDALRRK